MTSTTRRACPAPGSGGVQACGRDRLAAATAAPGRIEGRIFIVGCPRSGTTLLQSVLAAHSRVLSFPESHFFRLLLPTWSVPRRLGLASRTTRRRVAGLLDELGFPQLKADLPSLPMLRPWWVRRFVKLLDQITLARGRSYWIEKTPDHLHHIPLIERHVPDPRFIHLLRGGPEVVASLYEVSRRHPQVWAGPWTIEQCVRAWNRSVCATRTQLGKKHHHLVRYEQFVGDPAAGISSLCRFLGLALEPAMAATERASDVVRRDEPWKREATGAIDANRAAKFGRLFSAQEQRQILDQLEGIADLDAAAAAQAGADPAST